MRRFLLLPLLLISQTILFAQNICRTTEYRQQQLIKYPELASKVSAIENFTQNFIQNKLYSTLGINSTSNGSSIITVPVVVHVLYNSTQQNISDAQIQSQINILNQDYRRLNADTVNTPFIFQSAATDCGFQFELAKVDPNGYSTNGIVRKQTSIQAFAINDAMKFSAQGGDDGWDKDNYLNIWVCNLNGGVLGYSSIVGCAKENDGVVVLYTAFGNTGTATAPYNKGRTATHEIGHWLNLIHTWGDADCGDDLVADTPPQQAADYGCPSGIILSCNNAPVGNMYQNYMDFTNDACMNLFTNGQKARMLALFQPGGERYALLSSAVLTATTLSMPVPSTADNATSFVSVYPNPSNDNITVKLSDDISVGSELDVYNQIGQKITSLIVTQSQFQLNISSFAKGVYFIKVNGNTCKVMTKLMKL
jgi:hypothetical protein